MPDSVPNYLTVDANGNVGANFSGHVHAAGLDLTSPDAGPTTAGTITWNREVGGGVSASVDSWYNSILDDASHLEVFAKHPTPNNGVAGIAAQSGNSGHNLQAVVTGTPARTVLDQSGNSDFLHYASLVQCSDFNQAPGFNLIGSEAASIGPVGIRPEWHSDTGIMFAKKTGMYIATLSVAVNSPSAAWQCRILKNGNVVAFCAGDIGGWWEGLGSAATLVSLAAGDSIEYRYSGGPNPLHFIAQTYMGLCFLGN